MLKSVLFATASAALFVFGSGAHATDLQNLDDASYVVTLTDGADIRTIDVAPLSEVEAVCDSCTISLADGQTIETTSDTMVSIAEGQLISDAE